MGADLHGDRALPSFVNPPVNEVACGLQYATPLELGMRDMIRVSEQFEDRYPTLQELLPIPHIDLGGPQAPELELQLVQGGSIHPRLWFVGKDPTELVQFQRDRLTVNWRKSSDEDVYPRWHKHVMPAFIDARERLVRALANLQIDEPPIDMIDVSYVNPIPLAQGDTFASVLRPVRPQTIAGGLLPDPSSLQMALNYSIPSMTHGSLAIGIQSVQRVSDNAHVALLQLTVRAQVDGTIEHALACMNEAREWIVRGFAEVTTDAMHERWGME